MMDPAIVLVVRLAVATLFALAAWHKLREWPRIGGVIAGYRIVPEWAAVPIARVLIVLEFGVAVGALVTPQALLGAALLLLTYAAAMGINIARGNDRIDCGCNAFGTSGPGLVWPMVIRNTTIALIAVGASVHSAPTRSLVWVDRLTAVFALLVLCVLYASLESNFALPKKGARK